MRRCRHSTYPADDSLPQPASRKLEALRASHIAAPPDADAQDLTLLTTKLYIPPPRPDLVARPGLLAL